MSEYPKSLISRVQRIHICMSVVGNFSTATCTIHFLCLMTLKRKKIIRKKYLAIFPDFGFIFF